MSEPEDRARILIVEDDYAVRKTLRRLLDLAGYQVSEAATGPAAVAAFKERCPDLLISDLVLPAPNGQELANLCRAECPGTPIIFMSGYSEDELHDLDIRQVVFLPKPLEPDELLTVVGRLVSGGEVDPD